MTYSLIVSLSSLICGYQLQTVRDNLGKQGYSSKALRGLKLKSDGSPDFNDIDTATPSGKALVVAVVAEAATAVVAVSAVIAAAVVQAHCK